MNQAYISVNKDDATPLYAQLKEGLKSAIREGKMVAGTKLPTEEEICKMLGVSRPVVRQAYSELVQDGIIERRRGKGTYVKNMCENDMMIYQLVSFKEEMALLGKKPSTRLLDMGRIAFNREIYQEMHLQPENGCLRISRIRYADKRPFMHIYNYVPIDLFPGLEKHDYSKESLYEVLAKEHQVKLVKASRSIRAQMVKPAFAAFLEVDVISAVHVVSSLVYDSLGRVVDYSVETFPGENHKFDFTVYRD